MWDREEEARKKGRKERNKSACPGRESEGIKRSHKSPPPPPPPHQFPTEVGMKITYSSSFIIFIQSSSVIWSWLMYHSPKFLWSSPCSSG